MFLTLCSWLIDKEDDDDMLIGQRMQMIRRLNKMETDHWNAFSYHASLV